MKQLLTTAALAASLSFTEAALQYENRAEYGSLQGKTGKAEYCGTGNCKDGTLIGQPGLCYGWSDVCTDFDRPPRCASTQVLDRSNCGPCGGIDSGSGTCYINGYQWQKSPWTWHCFDCPPGYIGVATGQCGGSPYWDCRGHYPPGPCVGCSEPGEVLMGNPDSGWYCSGESKPPTCTRAPRTASTAGDCAIYGAVNDYFSWLNNRSTVLGALCLTNNVKGNIIASVSLLLASSQVWAADVAHKESATQNLALTLKATIESWLLTDALLTVGVFVPGLAIPEALLLFYEGACDTNTFLGFALTAITGAMQKHPPPDCPTPKVSRSLLNETLPQSTHLLRRDDASNPCTSFLSYFPATLADTIYAAQDACRALARYIPGDALSNGTAEVLREARKQCDNQYSSTNLTLAVSFAGVLDAVKAFEPYCFVNASSISSSLSGLPSTSLATQSATSLSSIFTAVSSSVLQGLESSSSTLAAVTGTASRGLKFSSSSITAVTSSIPRGLVSSSSVSAAFSSVSQSLKSSEPVTRSSTIPIIPSRSNSGASSLSPSSEKSDLSSKLSSTSRSSRSSATTLSSRHTPTFPAKQSVSSHSVKKQTSETPCKSTLVKGHVDKSSTSLRSASTKCTLAESSCESITTVRALKSCTTPTTKISSTSSKPGHQTKSSSTGISRSTAGAPSSTTATHNISSHSSKSSTSSTSKHTTVISSRSLTNSAKTSRSAAKYGNQAFISCS